MEIIVRGAHASLAVVGEVDVTSIDRLRAVVGMITDLPGIQHLEVDARRIGFVDSAGLRGLLLTRADAQLAGVSWWVTSSSPALRRLLELAGICELLTVPDVN